MAKKKIHTDSLRELLETANPEMLVNLIVELADLER
jgi:hypothetical protein